MKASRAQSRSPVVVKGDRFRRRRVRSARDEVLGTEALDMPMPGPILVLLSRLVRSERVPSADDGEAG